MQSKSIYHGAVAALAVKAAVARKAEKRGELLGEESGSLQVTEEADVFISFVTTAGGTALKYSSRMSKVLLS